MPRKQFSVALGVHLHPLHPLATPMSMGICYAKVCLSVCLSVPPSVTLVSHALTVQDIEICFAPHNRGTFLVSRDQIYNTEVAYVLSIGTNIDDPE